MERQKRKLKGIADLYNIEDERQRRQPTLAEDITQQNIPHEVITEQVISNKAISPNVSQEDIPQQNTSETSENTSIQLSDIEEEKRIVDSSQNITSQNTSNQNISRQDISIPAIWTPELIDTGRGYFPVYNDVTDRLIRDLKLDVYEQSVLLKMYRESRGWKSDECEISHAEIVRSCNISKSQSQRTLARLSARGLIVNLGRSKSGPERNRFRVLPGVPIIPHKNIFRENIFREGDDVLPENMVVGQDIFSGDTNKNNYKESLNTHTQPSVCAGSKFSLEECKHFAEHLQKTGQGINNPGGYATAIFRSGEADAQIEAFLRALPTSAPFKVDDCPDCGGSGYFYPEGVDKGVKICKHEKLKGAG
ncbi:MAG: replication protein [Pyrinomonadaceae bacterium]